MYNIVNASKEEMEFLIKLAKDEEWNPGLSDGKVFFDADPNGFFIGKLNGEPISCIAGVKYGDFAFVGLYIVKAPFRGKGYGLEIWNKAIGYLGDINIGLDGVPAQIENYNKSGFKLYHGSLRFAGTISVSINISSNIIPANEQYLNKIVAYDSFHFPGKRDKFLKGWFFNDCHQSLLWHENNLIRGMGVIRKCYHGYKVGPLFADTAEIGESLFLALSQYAKGETIYLDIIEGNKSAENLVKKFKMTKMFQCARMYTKARPKARWDNIYGITTFELG